MSKLHVWAAPKVIALLIASVLVLLLVIPPELTVYVPEPPRVNAPAVLLNVR
jgi:hypothetical protein